MSDGDLGIGVGASTPIFATRQELRHMEEKMNMRVTSINDHITSNTESINKLNKTLMGNGDDGLIRVIDRLTWKNQLVEKCTSIVIAIISSAVTAYVLRFLA